MKAELKRNNGRAGAGVVGIVALAGIFVFLSACAQESDVIGLQRPVYTDEKSVITLHFFPVQSEAERYYRAIDAEEYFLFTSPWGDAEEFFENIEAETTDDGGKVLRFSGGPDDSAVDQVLEFIDGNDLTTILSVHN
ncbi:MAG: hypothetical protein EA426_19585 [Spirochaetaceae bacterium]|nr:MAG: hypothetical protein EA426_19585 [Spirochaetaceae bacterium]